MKNKTIRRIILEKKTSTFIFSVEVDSEGKYTLMLFPGKYSHNSMWLIGEKKYIQDILTVCSRTLDEAQEEIKKK